MTLPDFTQSDLFKRLRVSMGADLIKSFSVTVSSTLTIADLEEMATSGKDIDPNKLRVLENGTLAYKDSRVLLYIRDVSVNHNRNPQNILPRFHVADCDTLHKMKRNKRFYRYVVSIRTDGKFDLNFIRHNKEKHELHALQVCMNCLDRLSYKGCTKNDRSEKRKIRDNFSIDEYFSIYSRTLFNSTPQYTSADAPLNNYPKNWEEISDGFRKNIGYKCQNWTCGVNLSSPQYRKYLHVHHKNGAKNDCDNSNLEALCIYCHAEEFMHAHVRTMPDYKDFLVLRQSLQRGNDQNIASGQKSSSAHNADAFEVARKLAAENGIKVEDFRSKGGAFWVNHDKKSDDLATALSKLNFQYHAGRGWWKK